MSQQITKLYVMSDSNLGCVWLRFLAYATDRRHALSELLKQSESSSHMPVLFPFNTDTLLKQWTTCSGKSSDFLVFILFPPPLYWLLSVDVEELEDHSSEAKYLKTEKSNVTSLCRLTAVWKSWIQMETDWEKPEVCLLCKGCFSIQTSLSFSAFFFA